MSRLDSVQSLPAAAGAGVSAVSAWIAIAADAAMQVFGVPLPVVLAALTGAFGARVFLPPAPFWRSITTTVLWTAAGAFLAQLALWVATAWFTGPPPSGALAGLALVCAFIGQRCAPILWERGGAALARMLDQIGKGNAP